MMTGQAKSDMSDLNNNRIKRQASKYVATTYGIVNRALIKGTRAVSVQAHPDSVSKAKSQHIRAPLWCVYC